MRRAEAIDAVNHDLSHGGGAGRFGPGKLVSRKVAVAESSAVIAAMDSYDTLGFTVIDRF